MGLSLLDGLRTDIAHLSAPLQNSIIEDAILDLFLSMEDTSIISSPQDAVAAMKAFLKEKVFNWNDALELGNIATRISNKLVVHLNGKSTSGIDRLARALKGLSSNKESTLPIVVLAKVKSDLILTIRCPQILTTNTGQMDNLGFYLKFASKLLGVSGENVRVIPDKSLGEEVLLPTNMNRIMTNVIGAVDTSKGLYAGEVQKFPTGFEGNLVEILGSIKILKENITSVRKRPGGKDSNNRQKKSIVVTLNDLQDRANLLLNLKQEGMSPWIVSMIKGVLAESTKYTSHFFPGGFKYAVKDRNKVSTNEGILAKLGYVPVVPSTQKLREVMLTRVKPIVTSAVPDGKASNRYSIIDWSDKEESEFKETDFTEFRAGFITLIPKIEPLKGSFKAQISEESTSEKRNLVLNHFNSDAETVDALNTAYAIKSALRSKKKGVTPQHFLQARSRFINTTANKPIIDATGKEYKLYRDIPAPMKEYLQKFFHRNITGEKRSVDTMEIEQQIPSTDTVEGEPKSSNKKIKV